MFLIGDHGPVPSPLDPPLVTCRITCSIQDAVTADPN